MSLKKYIHRIMYYPLSPKEVYWISVVLFISIIMIITSSVACNSRSSVMGVTKVLDNNTITCTYGTNVCEVIIEQQLEFSNNYEVINVRHNGHVWTVLRNKKDSTYYGAYHLPDCGCR
jgi:hypothetical protein